MNDHNHSQTIISIPCSIVIKKSHPLQPNAEKQRGVRGMLKQRKQGLMRRAQGIKGRDLLGQRTLASRFAGSQSRKQIVTYRSSIVHSMCHAGRRNERCKYFLLVSQVPLSEAHVCATDLYVPNGGQSMHMSATRNRELHVATAGYWLLAAP